MDQCLIVHSSHYYLSFTMLQIRGKERQNDLYAKSCFVLHERTSRYALTLLHFLAFCLFKLSDLLAVSYQAIIVTRLY